MECNFDDSECGMEFNTERSQLLFKCKVCNIWCDTMDQFKIHQKSQKHIKKANKLRFLKEDKQLSMTCESSQCGINDGSVDILHSQISSSSKFPTSPTNESEIVSSEYIKLFNKERMMDLIKCNVCGIWCDTMEQFYNHQKSQKHMKKRENLKNFSLETPKSMSGESYPSSTSSSSISSFFCQVCNIGCNTMEQLTAHFSGQSHKKKSLKHEYKDWTYAEIPTSKSSDNTSLCSESDSVECKSLTGSNIFTELKEESVSNNKPPASQLSTSDIKNLLIPERQSNDFRCKLCNQVMNTQEMYQIHCRGSKHTKRLKILNISLELSSGDNFENIDYEMKYCEVCKITINANNMESHEKGKIHKEKLVKMTHTYNLSDVKGLKKRDLSPFCEHIKNMKLKPRKYQTEVYEKGLKSDCVIFLPTGTGKTFVAGMLILRMLEENPHYRVAFLVDKVLLVMQQHDFFKSQFENISMKRFDVDNGETNRKLRLIGLANSLVNTEHLFSVRDHDIVVATAELFRGLLSNKQLFWNEFCLVILDEAHHCVKEHPYNKLLREHQLYPKCVLIDQKTDIQLQLQNGTPTVNENQLQLWKQRRSKIIGLTASPAGDIDKEMTHTLLLALLEALGGVNIVNVIDNKPELDSYTSNSNIETKLINYSDNESNLREVLKTAFLFMVGKFERFIDLSKSLLVSKDCRTLTVEAVAEYKSLLKNRLLETEAIQKATINHVLSVLDIIDEVDCFGYECAWKKLKELLDNDNEKVWLSNNTIHFIPQTEEIVNQPCEEKSSVIQAIIDEAKGVEGDNRTILVLVRERETAHKFEKILSEQCQSQKLVLLVGHGAGSSKSKKNNKGMSVQKQKKALNLIRSNKNQIIVATSVAEEGVDLPDCDLVILINPPNSVQALVQIRGRARKKSSRLLMICRDQQSIDDLHHLQMKEKNIIESIDQILASTSKT